MNELKNVGYVSENFSPTTFLSPTYPIKIYFYYFNVIPSNILEAEEIKEISLSK